MAPNHANDDENTIRAVDISCTVIRAIKEGNGAGVTELANELGHSKSTIFDHLKTLQANKIIVKDDDEYHLGLRHLDRAEHVKDRLGYYDVVKKEVDKLAKKTDEVAQFATEEHGKLVYIYKKKGENGVQTASRVGKQESLHCTALGKSILAYESEQRRSRFIRNRELQPKTEHSITSSEELQRELEDTVERGYAIDNEENVQGIRCIAAPVMNDDKVVGAISVTGPSKRVTGERFETELPNKVMGAANVVELNSKFA